MKPSPIVVSTSTVAHYTPPGYCYDSGVPITQTTPVGRGYQASKGQLLGRLARIKGQVGGVERMVEEDRYCIDVLTQISAVQAALDKVALGLLDGHARTCVLDAEAEDQPQRAAELMAAVGRLMRRG